MAPETDQPGGTVAGRLRLRAAGLAAALVVLAACALLAAPPDTGQWTLDPARTTWTPADPDGFPTRPIDGEPRHRVARLPLTAPRRVQVSHLLTLSSPGRGQALLLPEASAAFDLFVTGVPAREHTAGPPLVGGAGRRAVLVSVPDGWLRTGLNRLDLIFEPSPVRPIAAPLRLAPRPALTARLARLAAWTEPVRRVLPGLAGAAAALALAAAVVLRAPRPYLGYAAAAACLALRTALEAAPLVVRTPVLPAILDPLLLILAAASLACAVWPAVAVPSRRPARLAAEGALGGLAAAALLSGLSLSFAFAPGLWAWRLSAIYAAASTALVAALAVSAAVPAGLTLFRVAYAQLDLSRVVRRQKAEIAAAGAALEEQMRRAAILEERQRLARDMHDGIGGQLVSLIARVRSRRVGIDEVETELRDGLSELRLVVDSLDASGHSLAEALAAFRARAQPHAEAAGLKLVWTQPEGLDLETDDPRWILNLYRLLQEAVSNAGRHSGGDELTIAFRHAGERRLELEVRDNGCGLRAEANGGKGLSNMAFRARQLGGELQVRPAEPGPGLSLSLTIVVPAPRAGADQSSGEISPS